MASSEPEDDDKTILAEDNPHYIGRYRIDGVLGELDRARIDDRVSAMLGGGLQRCDGDAEEHCEHAQSNNQLEQRHPGLSLPPIGG